MTFREQLKSSREEYWNDKITRSISQITDFLSTYQQYDEFVTEYYHIKLIAKLDADGDIGIACKINDKLMFIEDEIAQVSDEDKVSPDMMFCWIKNITGLLTYSRWVRSKLEEMEFNIIYLCDEEFKLGNGQERVFLQAWLELN